MRGEERKGNRSMGDGIRGEERREDERREDMGRGVCERRLHYTYYYIIKCGFMYSIYSLLYSV